MREPAVLCERTDAPRFYSLTQIEDLPTLSRKWAAGAHFGDSVNLELSAISAVDRRSNGGDADAFVLGNRLAAIAALIELEAVWLYGTTKIVDDDLASLAGLPRLTELRIMSRRSYRPSVGQLQAHIANRE